MSEKYQPTKCCGYTPNGFTPYPVFWNPHNQVIQCHNCGQVYVSKSNDEQSKLERFTLAAMQGLLANPECYVLGSDITMEAIEVAKAMIQALNKEQEGK